MFNFLSLNLDEKAMKPGTEIGLGGGSNVRSWEITTIYVECRSYSRLRMSLTSGVLAKITRGEEVQEFVVQVYRRLRTRAPPLFLRKYHQK